MEAHHLRKTERDYGNGGASLYGLRRWECMSVPEVGIHGGGEDGHGAGVTCARSLEIRRRRGRAREEIRRGCCEMCSGVREENRERQREMNREEESLGLEEDLGWLLNFPLRL